MSRSITLVVPNLLSKIVFDEIFAPHLASETGFFCKGKRGLDPNWKFVKCEVMKAGQALGVFEGEKLVVLPQTDFFAIKSRYDTTTWTLLLNACFVQAFAEDKTATLAAVREAIHNFSRILRNDVEIVDGKIVTRKSAPGLIPGRLNAAKQAEDQIKAMAETIKKLEADLAAAKEAAKQPETTTQAE